MDNKLIVSLSPHIHSCQTTDKLMWNVVIALIPSIGIALWTFGSNAAIIIAVCCLSCMLTEWCIERFLMRHRCTLSDGSALITGLLLACNLPSILPWWMALIGSVTAIGIGKMSFGGLGRNIWNPALVGRVFLLISFPAAMTTWPSGINSGLDSNVKWANASTGASAPDASSGATLLTYLNDGSAGYELGGFDMLSMASGNMNGSLGEVGTIAILIGLAYMLCTKVITWHIPISVLASAAIFSWLFGRNPILDLMAGGLMLGAVFMATDYVTSPMTNKGKLIYGIFIGAITMIIRHFGSYPEGVSFAILIMNSFTPLINHYIKPRRFGAKRSGK